MTTLLFANRQQGQLFTIRLTALLHQNGCQQENSITSIQGAVVGIET